MKRDTKMREVIQIMPSMMQVQRKKRVAAYARVSMESERLMHSLSAQVSYYSELIQKNPEWIYAGVYADMYNQRLIQRLADGSVENGLKRRLSADLSILPKAFFFMLWNDCMIAKAI